MTGYILTAMLMAFVLSWFVDHDSNQECTLLVVACAFWPVALMMFIVGIIRMSRERKSV